MNKPKQLHSLKTKYRLGKKLNMKSSSEKGFSLIEVIISVAVLGMVLIFISNLFNMNVKYWVSFNKELEIKRNLNITKIFIEKGVRECNQANIIYDDRNKIIKGKNSNGDIVFVNLSGKRIYDYNTLIYFYKDTKEVRINKSGEHNVLAKYIDDIIIKEIIPEQLLEIVIFADQMDYSIKFNLRIN